MSALLGRDLAFLLALVVLGAAMLVVHLVAIRRVLGTAVAGRAKALVVLVPPAAPVVAWQSGHRKTAVTWVLVVVGYAVVRGLG